MCSTMLVSYDYCTIKLKLSKLVITLYFFPNRILPIFDTNVTLTFTNFAIKHNA